MTAKQTCDWMNEEGYLSKCILPEEGLNQDKGSDVKQHYSHRPPGDQLELMKWDNRLNNDLNRSVDWHIVATAHMDDENPKKFSLSTQKRHECVFAGSHGVSNK